nr:hypothetical protein [Tanacetum cinerariifolium]
MIVISQMSKLIEAQIITGTRVVMARTTITSLGVGKDNYVIEAKVYRKWISKSIPEMKEIAFCCILIDRELPLRVPYEDEQTSKMVYPILLGCIRSISDITPSRDANTRQKYQRKVDIESLDVNERRSWSYPSCSQCNKLSIKRNGIDTCEDHEKRIPPTYRYNFKAIVADGTTTAEFTFFTKAGQKITIHSCSDVMQKFEATDRIKLPIELVNTIGKKHIFQI